jgi:hypothetical protein
VLIRLSVAQFPLHRSGEMPFFPQRQRHTFACFSCLPSLRRGRRRFAPAFADPNTVFRLTRDHNLVLCHPSSGGFERESGTPGSALVFSAPPRRPFGLPSAGYLAPLGSSAGEGVLAFANFSRCVRGTHTPLLSPRSSKFVSARRRNQHPGRVRSPEFCSRAFLLPITSRMTGHERQVLEDYRITLFL